MKAVLMRQMRVVVTDTRQLEEMFEEVADAWGLSGAERDAVRGDALAGRGGRRRSAFISERMALVVEIDWLLCAHMDARQIRHWVRSRVAGVLGTSPLDDLVGSTDRLRRIRTMLSAELPQ
ncbi:MAG: hypothetical protein E7773_14770 [Sphingomonas sp.]|uniref:hypothetical protein n=1 Tax=Sphingomonas sp. TaxID=28214 RepID=UPI0012272876|nr:hypothetical protein [Sphingomonas sp.]THD34449.1 MAG: hypothetical protein E7773_14770 [Sphingomonas sp.]